MIMEKHPVEEVAQAIMTTLEQFKQRESLDVISGISMVLTTLLAEMDVEEEKAIYSFTKSLGQSYRRIKAVRKAMEKQNVH
jgi:hypothetical protein